MGVKDILLDSGSGVTAFSETLAEIVHATKGGGQLIDPFDGQAKVMGGTQS